MIVILVSWVVFLIFIFYKYKSEHISANRYVTPPNLDNIGSNSTVLNLKFNDDPKLLNMFIWIKMLYLALLIFPLFYFIYDSFKPHGNNLLFDLIMIISPNIIYGIVFFKQKDRLNTITKAFEKFKKHDIIFTKDALYLSPFILPSVFLRIKPKSISIKRVKKPNYIKINWKMIKAISLIDSSHSSEGQSNYIIKLKNRRNIRVNKAFLGDQEREFVYLMENHSKLKITLNKKVNSIGRQKLSVSPTIIITIIIAFIFLILMD